MVTADETAIFGEEGEWNLTAKERRAANSCCYSAAPIGSNWTWSIAVVAGESTAETWVMKKVR